MANLDISQLKFMVIDANPFMRRILRELLLAYHVRNIKEAGDGAAAFQELHTFKPDVILLEWEMQPLGGLDFAQLVRKGEDSPDKYLPMIMISAHSEMSKIQQARDAGINEFLVKPISATSLFSRIKLIVEKPRPYIDTKNYFGPDRRRRHDQNFSGPERRVEDSFKPDQ